MKELLAHGLIHGDCLTVSGHTVAENLAAVPSLSDLGSQVYLNLKYCALAAVYA
jgi:dihydroxy-acid dehydratase